MLRVFEEVARHRSFSQAAVGLNVTQGAVSRQIKQLEDYLGILAGILVFGAVISWAWAPETKALTLNQACQAEPGESGITHLVQPLGKQTNLG